MKIVDRLKLLEINRKKEADKKIFARKLAYYFIFNNQVAFRDFWGPKMKKDRYKTRYYQYAPALSNDMSWGGARTLGKTDELIFSMSLNALRHKMKESLLTAFRKIHIKKPLEELIGGFLNSAYLRKFFLGDADRSLSTGAVVRTPVYSIKFKNGHEIKGISIGDDPAAVMIQGSHPHFRYMDEGQTYPESSWVKFQSTQSPEGSVDRYFGTCLLPETKIRIKNGLKPIIDIRKDDQILTHRGRYKKVSSLKTRHYSGKIVKFKTQLSHIPVAVTEDHLIYAVKSLPCWPSDWRNVTSRCYPRKSKKCLKCSRKQHLFYAPSWYRIGDLKNGDYVVFPRGIKNNAELPEAIDLTSYIKSKKGPKPSLEKLSIDKNFITIAAAYLAEGSADLDRVTFCFRKGEKISSLTQKALLKKRLHFSIRYKDNMEYVRVSNAQFFSTMADLFGRGAKNKKIPGWFYNLPKRLILLLLKIYILGDGHTKESPETFAVSISENLLAQLQLLSLKVKKDCSLRMRTSGYISNIFGRPCRKNPVFEFGYNKTKMTFRRGDYLYLKIIDFKKELFNGRVYNIEVEDDNSYCSGLTFFHNCDGRLNTPFHLINHKLTKFKGKRFFIPRMMEPWFDQNKKHEYIEAFGSEQSNEYKQQVLAIEGEPMWSLWSQGDILKNIDLKEAKPGQLLNSMITIKISQGDIKSGLDEKVGDSKDPRTIQNALSQLFDEFLINLPNLPSNNLEVILGVDAGWSSPTVILPFFFYENKWNLRCKILLTEKMIPDYQALIIDYIATKYSALVGIDFSDGEGKALATALSNPAREEFAGKNYEERVFWVEFQATMTIGYKPDGSEITEKPKIRTTKLLQSWFSEMNFNIYHDEDFLLDFEKEVQKKTAQGTIIITPRDVHIPEAMRVFIYVWIEKHGKIEIPKTDEEDFEDFGMVFPEKGSLEFSIFGRPGEKKTEGMT